MASAMGNHRTGGMFLCKGRKAMMAARTRKQARGELASTIRQEIAGPANRRQLARLPAFRPVEDLPEHLRQLLARLEESQGKP